MTILDWLAIISLSVAILSLLFFLFNLIRNIYFGKKLKKYNHYRVKNKKKKKQLIRIKKELARKRKSTLLFSIFFFLIILLGGGLSAYTVYYQSSNLGMDDKKALVNGYFHLRDVEGQLSKLQAENDEAAINNLRNLAPRLSAFALNKADYRISENGQNLLNRYYTSMKEYGINVSSRLSTIENDPQVMDELISDMEKVKKNEKKVFDTFKVNENALAEKR
ncbi:hypothetical protein [Candidatus Enterococcus ikei]|uniref:Uncharacterized protein n=1 Tax=Candidatus Enterococcus ikei TaxID=2815326 RepID=A0ABS3H2F1_9ENTE|nr:hypothetical protein [Enterococcus sp. DIV0869a]MBO0441171.1 hypothetical protein [Enterococcus sp. DIV0869a]